jgi:adenylate kinase
MVVVLLGPPGVGKGTQGARLAEDLGWERIATGDLLRAARSEGSDLGRRAQAYMDAGELVPDGLIIEMVRERVAGLPRERGILLDGFPRTVEQAQALENMLPELGRRVDGVLLFEAPDEVLVKRISGRRHCPQSGRIYNVYFDPPKVEGVCDESGAPLVHRSDDRPETVERRLDVYRELTEPLVAHYSGGSVPVWRVSADGGIEEVHASAREALVSALDPQKERA